MSKFATLEKEYGDLHSALFEAAQVHRRLCAPRLVRCGDFEIASEIFAVRYLPGDFFTVEEAGAGLILALGDVCGKGLAAGMWTPCLVGLVRVHAAVTSEPHAIVAGVNREFCRMHAPLTSVFMARLDPASGTLDYCSAGHPPALLLRADGRLESLSEGGMLLGMARAGAPTYQYHFTVRSRAVPAWGAHHAAELGFVFNNPGGFGGAKAPEWSQPEQRLADAMIGYWVQFAKTGDPNRDGLPVWPKFDAASESYLELGEQIEAGSRLCAGRCDQLDRILAAARSQEQQTGGR